MDTLVQTDEYGAINTRKISTADEIVVKSQYMNCMKDNTKRYWEQSIKHNNSIIPKRTIVKPCLDVTTVTKERKYQKVFAIRINHTRLYKGVLYV